eukprot:TRINITY_DN62678_c0_g1_i2.p1 TRINITY_DN62678_c0_g1~~TRINITY_DN62678_c0_g1_i2.p1  ORF type:complete len:281 (+),score=57.73 TRINITY_DN62678_c0_g1_i2:21-863(+)
MGGALTAVKEQAERERKQAYLDEKRRNPPLFDWDDVQKKANIGMSKSSFILAKTVDVGLGGANKVVCQKLEVSMGKVKEAWVWEEAEVSMGKIGILHCLSRTKVESSMGGVTETEILSERELATKAREVCGLPPPAPYGAREDEKAEIAANRRAKREAEGLPPEEPSRDIGAPSNAMYQPPNNGAPAGFYQQPPPPGQPPMPPPYQPYQYAPAPGGGPPGAPTQPYYPPPQQQYMGQPPQYGQPPPQYYQQPPPQYQYQVPPPQQQGGGMVVNVQPGGGY